MRPAKDHGRACGKVKFTTSSTERSSVNAFLDSRHVINSQSQSTHALLHSGYCNLWIYGTANETCRSRVNYLKKL